MKFFIDETVDRITLDESQWVDIKHEMSVGDWERVESAMFQIEMEDTVASNGNRRTRRMQQQATQQPKYKFKAGYLDILEVNIMAWSFPKPLNSESISKMHPTLVNMIMEEIDNRNQFNPLGASPASQT